MKKMKKTTILLVAMLLLFITGCAPADTSDTEGTNDLPHDYTSLVGTWYAEGEDESELVILSVEGNELTFSFYGGEDPITAPIIDNKVQWTITSYDGEDFIMEFIIHEDGIDYISGDLTTRYVQE